MPLTTWIDWKNWNRAQGELEQRMICAGWRGRGGCELIFMLYRTRHCGNISM
jgi:hypothetical protein